MIGALDCSAVITQKNVVYPGSSYHPPSPNKKKKEALTVRCGELKETKYSLPSSETLAHGIGICSLELQVLL